MISIRTTNTATARLKRLMANTDQVNEHALWKTGMRILDDVLNVQPKPPLDTGNLRGSGVVFVGNKLMYAGEFASGASHNSPKNVCTVALDTPYTAWQHERMNPDPSLRKHNRPSVNAGVGPFFIRNKITRFADEYKQEYEIYVQEGLKKFL